MDSGHSGCVSGRGSSVVDYCIVGAENLGLISNFKVATMSESIETMKLVGVATRVPDHSILQWEVVRDGVSEVAMEEKPPEVRKKYVVPENYLQNEIEIIRGLENKLKRVEKEQKVLDEIYEEIVVVLKRGLVEKRVKRGHRGQPWFTKEMAGLRKDRIP